MLLPYPPIIPCLVPYHSMYGTQPASGIPPPPPGIPPPTSGIPPPVWYPTIHVWYPNIPVWYPTIPIWYPTIPVWYSTCDWYPTTLLEPHYVSGIPSHALSGIPHQYPTATILPTVPNPPLPIAAPIWPLTAPYSLIWPIPAHHLELLLHTTTLLPATAIWPSCPYHPLPPLPSGTPGPNSLSHLAPHHCPFCPHYPHPNLDLLPPPHQISSPKVPFTQKGNLSFSEFPSFSMFISISPHMGSISSCVKIISFTSCRKIPKIVVKQPRFHQ